MPVVLQHSCFVYSCTFAPLQHKRLHIVTGAFDGYLRLWTLNRGKLIDGMKVGLQEYPLE